MTGSNRNHLFILICLNSGVCLLLVSISKTRFVLEQLYFSGNVYKKNQYQKIKVHTQCVGICSQLPGQYWTELHKQHSDIKFIFCGRDGLCSGKYSCPLWPWKQTVEDGSYILLSLLCCRSHITWKTGDCRAFRNRWWCQPPFKDMSIDKPCLVSMWFCYVATDNPIAFFTRFAQ